MARRRNSALEALETGGPSSRRERRMGRLGALVAPLAANAGAVVDDPNVLEIARAVCAAFGQGDAAGGLTRIQILERIGDGFDRAVVESRLDVFEKLDLLRPYLSKAHQHRYTLNPAGLVGQQVFERIGERGGVDELLALLDRTRALFEDQPDRSQVHEHVRHLIELLAVYASDVERLVATAPLHELLAEHADHDRASALDELSVIATAVTERFPDLARTATTLVEEASRYLRAVESLMVRVLDEGGRSRDFAVLAPDDYLSAAIDGRAEVLAAAFAGVVFDPPTVWVSASELLHTVDGLGPPRRRSGRPPAPPPSRAGDPVGDLVEGARRTARQRALRAEQLLNGAADVEVTGTIRGLPWTAAATLFADLLALDRDPDQGYEVAIGEATIVDAEADVTYSSPVALSAARPPIVTHDVAEVASDV